MEAKHLSTHLGEYPHVQKNLKCKKKSHGVLNYPQIKQVICTSAENTFTFGSWRRLGATLGLAAGAAQPGTHSGRGDGTT